MHLQRLPARTAEPTAIPPELPGALRSCLANAGIEALWSHQAEARGRILSGEHVVLATGTASGKSLAYQLPAAERILADDRSVVLYLAPTKALARDQLRAVRSLGLPGVRAAVVDGDTPPDERTAVRRSANWVLTNPDLLHASILGDHRRWAEVLHRLALVVIDESHTARGVFGSHVALVLRRLRRLLERYGAEPTFVLTSATIGNPAEHARALTGLPVTAVTRDGSPRGAMDLGVWLPPTDASGDRRTSTLEQCASLLSSFVAAGVQTLAFAGSRRATEVIAVTAQRRLADAGSGTGSAERAGEGGELPLAERVAAYRAGYLADERRALERRLRSGELLGVAATEALELGIDVSGLDAVLLAGWPGTSTAFWQRLGRAGRAGTAAVGVLIAAEDPLDHYLVRHPEELTSRPAEDAIVDAANPYLLTPHLRCACQEAPIDDDEARRWFGPSATDLLAAEVAAGRLRRRGGRTSWPWRHRAAGRVGLRSAGSGNVRIVDAATGAVIGDVDEERSHRQVHDGAVYLHQGRTYLVDRLDLDAGVALVREAGEVGFTTRPRSDTDVRIVDTADARGDGVVDVARGRVEVTSQVTGFDVLRLGGSDVLDRVDLDLPATTLDTSAVWFTVTDDALSAVGLAPRRVPGSLHAAEHAAIGMLPLLALCDRWDLGGLSTAEHPDTGLATVFIYDGVPGGAGLAERSYHRFDEHLAMTRSTIAGCRCTSGCLSCVHSPKCGNGNDPLDKAGALAVLDLVTTHRGGDGPGGRSHAADTGRR